MPKEEFQLNLSRGIYGNRALNHIFITYCEHLNSKLFDFKELTELVAKTPNIEHILSQTPTFEPSALGFDNKEDFIDYEHQLGNLTLLEKGLNSSIQNKSPIDKIEGYGRSFFSITRGIGASIHIKKGFSKTDLKARTKVLANYCAVRWWSDRADESPETIVSIDYEISPSN
jgi:Protein of unknown function (DUF1524)